MTKSKLMNFKDWLLFNFEMTAQELEHEPLTFQALVHTSYTVYVEEWDDAELEETEHQKVD